MTSRGAFLGRLQRRLAVDRAAERAHLTAPVPRFSDAIGGVDGFTTAWRAHGGHVHHAPDPDGVAARVEAAVGGRGPVLAGTEPAGIAADLRWPACGRDAAARAAVGLVPVRAGIAATGSVLIDTAGSHGRSVALLPPVCIFLLAASDIVDTPSDVFRNRARWWPARLPSQIVLVTGPSRSADIEMTLTVGVHGPGEVHVVICG